MLNLNTARELVAQFAGTSAIFDKLTKTTEWGWVFFYGNDEKSVTPLLVDKHRETVINVGNGPIDKYIDAYTTDREEIIRQINGNKSI